MNTAAPSPAELAAIADRCERELLENVIPFWEAHAVDRQHGGFFCYLLLCADCGIINVGISDRVCPGGRHILSQELFDQLGKVALDLGGVED